MYNDFIIILSRCQDFFPKKQIDSPDFFRKSSMRTDRSAGTRHIETREINFVTPKKQGGRQA
jgi:hypothetical protein